ncbi:hypothetical protein Curi_c11120 [Gottschalkia acidurici 9a]|uniref:Uncharacterized protein n=1 Tax=Gottschalkia acidurici (strain ATCC 7906 / DSM 604 / BCRC 14475 / CIP 104303 / KCTC 5404 / NCIMB 10678 / 9a) TaxID=1128398 RepID=K0B0F2_GOTA9|nr:hypothetical protein [Gottschalkia acidurici]AFS78126.1 hypothetical protein Curi_c11120 [Gottschalkia acidurici 9a]
MKLKDWVNQMIDILGTLLTIICISITMLNKGFLATLPIIIVLAFCLSFFNYKIWYMLATAFIMHIILGVAIDTWLSILTLINSTVEIGTGFLLATYIKKLNSDWRQAKYIILGTFSIIFTVLIIIVHMQIYGTSLGYFEAKVNVMNYINKTYNGKLEITGVRHNSKMTDYIIDVKSKNDSREKGSIYYSRGANISDDYHFRIERNQAEMVESMLKMIINKNTSISEQDISLWVDINLPKNKYSKTDIYSGNEPISIGLTIKPNGVNSFYDSKESFSKEAYKILNILKELDFYYKTIEIKSFLDDGNTSYSNYIEDPIKIENWESAFTIIEKTEYKK